MRIMVAPTLVFNSVTLPPVLVPPLPHAVADAGLIDDVDGIVLIVVLSPALYGLPGTASVFRSKIKGLNQQGAREPLNNPL